MQRLNVGDQVVVIRGNEKGKRGKISRFVKDRSAVIVENVNIVKRHMKQTPQKPGGILEIEAPMAVSSVMIVDPSSNKPTRVSIKVEGDKKVRVGKSGTALPATREK